MVDLNSIILVFLRLVKRFIVPFTILYFSLGDFVNIIEALESYFGISLDRSRDHEGKRNWFDIRLCIASTLCLAFARGVEYLADLLSELLGLGDSPRMTSEPPPSSDPLDFKNSKFAYHPLNPPKHEIRLLYLPQRTDNQSMLSSTAFTDTLNRHMYPNQHQFYHCTLKQVSLDNAPKYEALSYTWGVPEPTTQIIVDGQPFWITRHLAAALHHLTGHRDLLLWVDAICINQKDNAEKSWQVRQMQQVYQQANRVLVWLGESNMGSMRALNKLAQFESFDWSSSNNYDLSSKPTIKAWAAVRELDALFRLEKDAGQNSVPRVAHKSSWLDHDGQFPLNEIGTVLERAWWGRIWVVQELALAKDVSFVCGYNEIPGKCIRSFLNIWNSLNRGFVPRMLDHRPWALFEIRDSVQTRSPLPIKDILQITSKAQLEATDPRDHIFALLGLMKEGEQLKDLIDYEKSPESYVDVYIEVAKSLLDENELWIFSFCNFLGSPTPSLPSWAPNWSRQSGQIPLLQTGGAAITGRRSPFCAWKGAQPSTTFIDQIPPRLTVSGIEVDTVTMVGTLRPAALFNDVNNEIRSKILGWLRGFRDLVPEDCMLGSKYRKEALWRTPIADQWHVESTWIRPEPWIGDVYNLLLSSEDAQLSSGDYTMQYFEYMMAATNTRIPFSTKKGYLGLGSEFIRPGDLVVVLFGSDVPVVLRETGDGRYTLIGEAFVSGIMYGEIVEEMGGHPRRSEIFELV